MNADYVWKLSKFGRLTSTRLRYDDDFADRLNYQFTGLLLFVFIGIIGIRQYVGKPIQCWTPQEFTRAWEEYAENYCWVASTYFIHLTRYPTSNILISQSNFMPNGYIDTNGQRVFQPYSIYPKFPKPKAGELPSDGQLISYYQWAPILLAVQSFLFYLPCLVWRLFSNQSGFQVSSFLSQAGLPENFDMVTMPNSYYSGHKIFDDCSQTVNELSVDEPLNNSSTCSCWSTGTRKRPQRTHISYVPPCRYQGNFLVRLYMLVKILYLSNVVGQIFLLEYYTGVEYNFYGIRVLYDLARGRQWEESGHFPRVTFCDFEAKKLAQSHYYTLQCVLPINMFLEKIYIFLWLWFFIVGVVTFSSIVIWIRRIGTRTFRFTWIQQQLITIRQFNKDVKGYEQFVDNHLGPDGVFILRLIAQNYGDLVAGDTIGELWVAYWQRRSTGLSERRPTDSISRKPPSPASTFNRFDQPQPTDTYTKNPQSRNQRSGAYQMPMTLTRGQIENKPARQGKKDKSRRMAAASGFPAALLATEMVHPVDRFGVPLIAATRKPPSLPSRSSSRYSDRSRSRDRSESPPPIPQRSPGCENYSLSDRQSVKDFEHQSEHSSVIYPVSPTGADDEEIVEHPNEVIVENDHIVNTQGSVEYEDPQGNIYTEDHDNEYIDDVQNDDNIV
ncbi:hypothetical protein MN116_003677 [Schistosoma mekongi]|uniref:Innexin n=1 Tax=Schistosoma mekongi TaxID=38744 RepID=A0AAE2D5Z3_SCHME|nr:hypothetical protein MN116_003677 [Schistosoma mekongi]